MKIHTSQILFILASSALYLTAEAASPTDAELLQLEQQIKQQEAEQEKARQRAAEEARRKVEEQKLREERARLEEERRRLEEEKRAVEMKKQEEERQRRIAEEQQNAAEESRKKEQFEVFMNNAASAMDSRDYAKAREAYAGALELIPDDPSAVSGLSLASKYYETCTAIVGEWDWFLASVTINSDNTMNAVALIPNNGTWECTDPELRKFTFRWAVGGWVDKATLSEDGNKIDAVNNIGMGHQAWRKGTKRDQPAQKNPIYGN